MTEGRSEKGEGRRRVMTEGRSEKGEGRRRDMTEGRSEKGEGRRRDMTEGRSEKGEGRRRDIGDRTFQFALRIVRVCQALDETPGVARTLGRQLLRAGTSIGANVREAQAGQSKPDFISKNAIALKEAHETAYWLELITQSNLLEPQLLVDISRECGELTAILTTIVKRARENAKLTGAHPKKDDRA